MQELVLPSMLTQVPDQHEFGSTELGSIKNRTARNGQALPSFPPITKTRWTLLRIGICLAILDLCVLPITYFYSLTYGTSLKPQDGKIGMMARELICLVLRIDFLYVQYSSS